MKSRTKKRLTALLVIFAVGAGGVIGLRAFRNSGRAVVAEEMRERGQEAYAEENYPQAIELLNVYVSSGGRAPDAMLDFARARSKVPQPNNRHLAQAVTIAREVAASEDPPGEAHELLMDLYPQLGRIPELIDLTTDIQQRDPANVRAGVLRAQSLMQLSRDAEALGVAQALAETNPGSTDAQAMVLEIMIEGDAPFKELLERARAIRDLALEQPPIDPEPRDPKSEEADEQVSTRSELLLIAAQAMLRLAERPDAETGESDSLSPRSEAIEILAGIYDNLENESLETVEVTVSLSEIASGRAIDRDSDEADQAIELANNERLYQLSSDFLDSVLLEEIFAAATAQADALEIGSELLTFAIQRRYKQGSLEQAGVALMSLLVNPSMDPDTIADSQLRVDSSRLGKAGTDDLGLLLTMSLEPGAELFHDWEFQSQTPADEETASEEVDNVFGLTLSSEDRLTADQLRELDRLVSDELVSRRDEGDDSARHWLHIADSVRAFYDPTVVTGADGAPTQIDLATLPNAGFVRELGEFLRARELVRSSEPALAKGYLIELAPDPAWRRARLALATVFLEEGDTNAAIQTVLLDPQRQRWQSGIAILLEGAIELAERSEATSQAQQQALGFTQYMLNLPPEVEVNEQVREAFRTNPQLISFYGRAQLANGLVSEALQTAARLREIELSKVQAAARAVAVFADRLEPVDPDVAGEVRNLALTAAASEVAVVIQRVETLLNAGRAEEASRLIEAVEEPTSLPDRTSLAVARLVVARELGDETAVDRLYELSMDPTYSAFPSPMIAFLESPAAWENLARVDEVIEVLKTLTEAEGLRFKIYEARRDIQKSNTEEVASNALLAIEEVLDDDPQNRQALVIAADAANRLGDRGAAIDYLERARQAAPQRPEIYPSLISLLVQSGRADEAATIGESFSQLRIQDSSMLETRARVLEPLGLRSSVLADRSRLAELGGARNRIEYARILLSGGNQERAAEQVSGIDPDTLADPDRLALAEVLAGLGEIDRAVEIIQIAGTSSQTDGQIGQLYLTVRDGAQALPYLSRSAQAEPSRENWMLAIRASLVTGDRDLIVSTLSDASTAMPNDRMVQSLQSALAGSREWQVWTPVAASTLTVASVSEAEGGADLASIVERLLTGELERSGAISALARLTERHPDWYPAWLLLSNLQADAGQLDRAVATARAAAEALPGQVRPIADATRLLLRAGRFSDAAALAQDWQRLEPANPFEADISRGSALSGIGRHAQALESFEPHIERMFETPDVWSGPIQQYLASVADVRGLDAVDSIFSSEISDSETWGLIVIRLASIVPPDRADLARSWLNRASAMLDSTPRGRFLLASGWNSLGNRTGEANDYRESTGISTEDALPETHAAIGSSFSAIGQLDAAYEAFQQAHTLGARDAFLLNNLAYHMVRTDRNAVQAISYAEAALDAAARQSLPDQIRKEMLDTLGLAQMKAGLAAEAVETFRDAVRLDRFAPHLQVGLAEALAQAGDLDEARATLARLRLNQLEDSLRDRAIALQELVGND